MGGAAAPLLQVRGLTVSVPSKRGPVTVVDGVDLEIGDGETLCLVGESASGKSLTALSLLGLQGDRITSRGAIHFGGRDLMTLDERAMAALRGREIAMIFQEAVPALNPIHRIGRQLTEALMQDGTMGRRAARLRSKELMQQVGIRDASARLAAFPHQFSGGMAQRVMIAMALAQAPALLIADEPTTALDVTIQAQILDLLADLRQQQGLAMLLITHDMGVVAETADRVAVMYAGRIVETAPVHALFAAPAHPYTAALLAARPGFDDHAAPTPIGGEPPDPGNRPSGCAFAPRCARATDLCQSIAPTTRHLGNRSFACHHPHTVAP
nr:ABC transporter ATP-binding protein [Phaeobacter sp. J2-8]